MSEEKSLHPVFQVLNYLDENPLPDQERIVLIEISRHDQSRFDIMINQVAKNCGKSPRAIKYTLLSLVKKEVIVITNHRGRPSEYRLNLTQKLSTTRATGCTSEAGCTSATDCTTPVQLSVRTRATGCTTNSKYNNKNNKKREEPARAVRLPLSSFEPTEEHRSFCLEHGLDLQAELASFKKKSSDFGNLNSRFSEWLIKAIEYKSKRTSRQTDEPKSTVKFWGPGHPDWDRLHANRRIEVS